MIPKLTMGERLYLLRRRMKLTQEEAAYQWIGPGEWREINAMERGKKPISHDLIRTLELRWFRPEPWELLQIWRRREGWTIREAARHMRLSHITLIARERGEWSWRETERWWNERAARLSANRKRA